MEIQPQPQLHFNGVDILDVRFQSRAQYQPELEIKLTIDSKVYFPDNEPVGFKILMSVLMDCPNVFELFVTGMGHFSTEGNADEVRHEPFVHHNAPAILFPYLRSFITTLTANLGNVTGALTIPPHFFRGHLEEIRME